MTEKADEFQGLMQRIRDGDQEAVRELCAVYGDHVLRVVRRRLAKRLRAKYDSVDFTQDVWASFFAVPPENFRFESPEMLIGYLANMARNKVLEVYRQRTTQKYDMTRERSLNGSARGIAEELTDREPSPSQVISAEEQYNQMWEKYPRHCRALLDLRQRGWTFEQIGVELGLCARTVRRLFDKMAAGAK